MKKSGKNRVLQAVKAHKHSNSQQKIRADVFVCLLLSGSVQANAPVCCAVDDSAFGTEPTKCPEPTLSAIMHGWCYLRIELLIIYIT